MTGHSMDDPTGAGGDELLGGRYKRTRLIGRGGMGEVYAATNVKTGREVAIKIIRAAHDNPDAAKRFMREAKTATAIQHPNVIDVLDLFEHEDGTPVMVMELLAGESLASLLKRERKLPLSEVATIMLPVVSALAALHDKGIVHRDLKPDNIFLSDDGGGSVVPKVLDFGIAKVLDPAAIGAETQGHTHTGSLLGTPHYMSFEQAMSDKNIDRRADIWAVGVMLFEALAGERPLSFDNLGQMYQLLLQGEVPSIRERGLELPAELADLVDACLKKDREERLGDLAPLVAELSRHADPLVAATLSKRLVASGALDAPVASYGGLAGTVRRPAASRAWLVGVAAIAVAALIAIVVYTRRSNPAATTSSSAAATSSALAAAASASPTSEAPVAIADATASTTAGAVRTGSPRTSAPVGLTPPPPKKLGERTPPPPAPSSKPVEPKPQPKKEPKGIVENLPY